MNIKEKPVNTNTISKNDLKNIIRGSAVEKYNIKFGELEEEIVTYVVNNFPERPSNFSVVKWCKKIVEEKLKEHPELKESFDKFRKDINDRIFAILNESKSEGNKKLVLLLVDIGSHPKFF